jgi:hypothetical protein
MFLHGCVENGHNKALKWLAFLQKVASTDLSYRHKTEILPHQCNDLSARFRDTSSLLSDRMPVQPKALFLMLLLVLGSPNFAEADPPLLLELRKAAAAGDLRPVSEMITGMKQGAVGPADELSQVLLQQYQERFLTAAENQKSDSDNALVDGVIKAYREYWRAVLTYSLPSDTADRNLQAQLRELVAAYVAAPAINQDIFQQLETTLTQQGFGSSAGITSPWRDLYIWREQYSEWFVVRLTDTMQRVQVTFIEHPLIQGWQHFASLDLVSTSGWASSSGLYCLCGTYDLGSTAFMVSWLKHETRHSVDLELFPGMEMTQLEYRAKLTELAFAGSEDRALLRQFTDSAGDAGGSAHSMANARVSREIYREIFKDELPTEGDPWRDLGPYKVAPAARKLLERDTEALKAAVTGN